MVAQVGNDDVILRFQPAGDAVPIAGRPQQAMQEDQGRTLPGVGPVFTIVELHPPPAMATCVVWAAADR
jgi:hypothetical protein